MKNIVVISPYDGDGKTTMIETIVGSPLQWYVSDVSCEYLTGPIMHADIQYSGMQFRIFEIPAFKEKLNLSHFYAKAQYMTFFDDMYKTQTISLLCNKQE